MWRASTDETVVAPSLACSFTLGRTRLLAFQAPALQQKEAHRWGEDSTCLFDLSPDTSPARSMATALESSRAVGKVVSPSRSPRCRNDGAMHVKSIGSSSCPRLPPGPCNSMIAAVGAGFMLKIVERSRVHGAPGSGAFHGKEAA